MSLLPEDIERYTQMLIQRQLATWPAGLEVSICTSEAYLSAQVGEERTANVEGCVVGYYPLGPRSWLIVAGIETGRLYLIEESTVTSTHVVGLTAAHTFTPGRHAEVCLCGADRRALAHTRSCPY